MSNRVGSPNPGFFTLIEDENNLPDEEYFEEQLKTLSERFENLKKKKLELDLTREIEPLLWQMLELGYHVSVTMSPNSGCHILYHKKDKDECRVEVVDVSRPSCTGEYGFTPIKGFLNAVYRKITLQK